MAATNPDLHYNRATVSEGGGETEIGGGWVIAIIKIFGKEERCLFFRFFCVYLSVSG